MVTRSITLAAVGIAFAVAVGGCTGTAASTSAPSLAVSADAPAASASPSFAPSERVAASDSPVPTKASKPLPSFDQAELDAYLTSSITLIDLADSDLSVAVSYVDPSSTDSIDLGTYALESTDQMTNQVPPGTYRLVFHQPAGNTSGPSCTIEVGDADGYVFAALGDAIAVSRTGAKPKNVGELFVSTSSLCQN